MRDDEEIEKLFDRVCPAPTDQRERLLAESGAKPEIQNHVRRLLAAAEGDSQLLQENLLADLGIPVREGTGDDELAHADVETGAYHPLRTRAGNLKPGQVLGNFRIESVIGQGGMSVVYRATQQRPVQRNVALKLIRPGVTNSQAAARFLQEQQALALLHHPNIATFFESGETPHPETGQPLTYCVLEFVDGQHLTEFCDSQRLGWQARLDLICQVLDALQYAHTHGIIHRDIKPGNILVRAVGSAGGPAALPVPVDVQQHELAAQVKLIDFGIAKLAEKKELDPTLTQQGQLLGSPRYMSPEQLQGGPIDLRTDLYSVGLVLFELLAGQPFRLNERDLHSADAADSLDVRLSTLRHRPSPETGKRDRPLSGGLPAIPTGATSAAGVGADSLPGIRPAKEICLGR